MVNIRHFTARHPWFFERLYKLFEALMMLFHPLFKIIGYRRLDKPVASIERVVKGFLFDTQMCGMCSLSSTGMACPMKCPKQLRNGPCGGVRANGHCEVNPDMPCVWVEAFKGSQRMQDGNKIRLLQLPVDHRLKDTSSWLREVRHKIGYVSKNADLL